MKWAVSFLIFISQGCFGQTIPNEKEFYELYRMVGMAAHAENDPELVKIVAKSSPQEFCPKKVVTKEKPKLSFYLKVTGPVEDMKLKDLYVDPKLKLAALGPIIQAQNESDRDLAIKSLCSGKSNIEKIEYGSVLFNLLSDVYNHDMTGDRGDVYSSSDPTKNQNQTNLITLQRQYNTLNREFYDGNQDWPPVAGVCRHASTLVSDFLTRCGMNVKDVFQVGYATTDSAHATVQVNDPQTGKSFFLNWGEIKEQENPGGMTNFDVPSEGIKSLGMFITVYSPDQKGKLTGVTRTNEGVVAARLLQVSDSEVDLTTYHTTEAVGVVDLGKKTKLKIKTGNWKEIEQTVLVSVIDARNKNASEQSESMQGMSATYRREAMKHFGDSFYWKNRLQASVGEFIQNEDNKLYGIKSSREASGYGGAIKQGSSLGITTGNESKTTFELGADAVGEYYSISNRTTYAKIIPTDAGKNYDTNAFVVTSVKINNESKTSSTTLSGNVRATIGPDMQFNDQKMKTNLVVYNPQLSFVYARKLQDQKSLGGSATYVGSIDRQLVRSEVFFKDNKNKFQASGGFTVLRNFENSNNVYSVVQVQKTVSTQKLDLKGALSAQKSLTSQAPVIVNATITITPNWSQALSPDGN